MRIVGFTFALVLGMAACGGKSKGTDPMPTETGKSSEAPASLYVRLGEKPAIEAVIDKFIANVVADGRINSFFLTVEPAEVTRFRNVLVDQVCEATGGPCKYTGKSMKEAHKGMGITDAQFTALVEDLAKALDDAGVKEADKTELLAALGGMQPDIVGQ